jgi:DNA polymerase-3 subunit delta
MPHLHLITGTGTAQRRLVAKEIAALSAKGYELASKREGGEWRSLLTENRGPGLFDERSVLVVEDAEKMGLMPENLAPLLEKEDASVVILLVAKSEVPAIVPKDLLAKCSRSKAEEPSPWSKDRDGIVADAARRHGVMIGRESTALIKELFEDAGELASEAEKAASFCAACGRREVSRGDIEALCLSDGGKSVLKLLDGVCSGQPAQSLSSLDALIRGGELLPTLSALHNRMRLAFYYSAFPQERKCFAKALGAKDYASRQADQAAAAYGKAKLRDFMTGLIRINANEKSGTGASWRDLHILVIELLSGLSPRKEGVSQADFSR